MKTPAAVAAVALAFGCSDGATPATATDAAVVDAGVADVVVETSDASSSTRWTGPFEAPFHYTGVSIPSGGYDRADITENVGTVTIFDDTRPALVAQTVDWSSAGYQLVHLYSTDTHDLQIAFLYCQAGHTAGVYVESLTEPITLFHDVTQNPCAVTSGAHTVTAQLRPFEGFPDGFQPVHMATIGGAGLTLNDRGVGRITLGGLDWTLTPFSWVDCPADSCGAPGWYEVHSLLQGRDGEVGSVILYLMRDNMMQVRTSYGLRLDVPGALPNTMYDATWSLL